MGSTKTCPAQWLLFFSFSFSLCAYTESKIKGSAPQNDVVLGWPPHTCGPCIKWFAASRLLHTALPLALPFLSPPFSSPGALRYKFSYVADGDASCLILFRHKVIQTSFVFFSFGPPSPLSFFFFRIPNYFLLVMDLEKF